MWPEVRRLAVPGIPAYATVFWPEQRQPVGTTLAPGNCSSAASSTGFATLWFAAASATVWVCRVWRWQAPTPVLLATKPGRLITVRAKIREGVPGPILRQRTPAAHAGAFVRFADRDY